ncbi:MAG: phosphotransferase [Fibrobacter sp.]|nr:phosphotransferase [Fibrobacter sp.]
MSDISLTPSQIDFIKGSIPEFSISSWNVELAGRAASQRYFVRLSKDNISRILVVWDGRDEDWDRFLLIQRQLRPRIPFLPEIYRADKVKGLILEEDLGTTTLKKFCGDDSIGISGVTEMYRSVLDSLHSWQMLDHDLCLTICSRAMDLETFLWESWYFAHYCVTDFCGCETSLNNQWEKERTALAEEASRLERCYIHRDFQSENIMLYNNQIRFVDFQGARLGPPEYDTASLLLDPYVPRLDEKLIRELFTYYISLKGGNASERSFYICAAQRLMQALGAYSNLSLHKGKEWYRNYIPLALERLNNVLAHLPDYEYIAKISRLCRDALKCSR